MSYTPHTNFRVSTASKMVMWQRDELAILLGVYGRYVAAGHWRDYRLAASTSKTEAALFTIHARAQDRPLYCIEKYTKPLLYQLRAIKGYGEQGHTLRRGQDLAALLRYFDRKQLKLAK
ncbi:MAG: DUF2794 domain-containing protein [Alphaproteobacteria bacterium]|nr:DUF2794 domain-containing protein [Alphaproteobacteria bacterium]